MARKVLCVAEKPAIAKAVAEHLSGGHFSTRSIRNEKYVKNYCFNHDFGPSWGQCDVTMTSVLGHLNEVDFPSDYRGWKSCSPTALFDAPIRDDVAEKSQGIAANIMQQARFAEMLFIWTDCDREGEYIGSEIRKAARKGRSDIEVRRAIFSHTERSHIIRAARQSTVIDERQVNAVSARIELDLRLGAAFTRFTSLTLQTLGPPLGGHGENKAQVISYGSCQFPTLGFVVDRYIKVRNFTPEQFWAIKVTHQREGHGVKFSWDRHRLFDRAAVVVLFERCIRSKIARVTKIEKKPSSKWKPLPLTTVELQKGGSKFLRMTGKRVMDAAEKLYQLGFISYPRTETDQFDKAIDLRSLVQKQTQAPAWGDFAQALCDGRFKQPRSGRHNDKAHPPIHPIKYAAPTVMNDDQRRVYEFVTRRFLACCSEDAKGETLNIGLSYGEENFHTSGLTVLERNYLDVYVYDRWESSQPLPRFTLHESFEPTEAFIVDGKTSPPKYLTEPELIALMDANGIGTDATMAEHIAKIQERDYVIVRNQAAQAENGEGGRTGRAPPVQEFIPTKLGMALIEGYNNIGLDISLSKPFLRKEMELKMLEICQGTKTRDECVLETLAQYREVYVKADQQKDVLKQYARRYVFDQAV